jgi:hypothetical protein
MTARIALTSALLLLFAAPASAKELSKVTVCGADGCVDRTARATHAVAEGGPLGDPLRRPVPFFVIRIGFGEEPGGRIVHRVAMRWFPASETLYGADGKWMNALPHTQRALRRLTRGVEPRPAGKLPPPGKPLSDGVTGQLPPRTIAPPPAEEERGGGGPSAALVAAPAALLVGLVALGARRRRRRE